MKKIIISILIVLALVIGIYYWQNRSKGNLLTNPSIVASESDKEISQYQYTESYTHPINHFSFNYPKEFTVTSIPSDDIETILVQSTTTKVAVQITISPFQGEDVDITSDIIKTEIPDMKIDNVQDLLVGPSRKGLAFVSDNPAFGGKSREVWFVFKGNLYQISTYYEFDEFLKGVFATWKFE
jgi:hypothetical protein